VALELRGLRLTSMAVPGIDDTELEATEAEDSLSSNTVEEPVFE